MIWTSEIEPDVFARAERITEVHGYLTFQLTGNWTTSTASADPTGALDMRKRDWSAEILDAIGVRPAQIAGLAAPGIADRRRHARRRPTRPDCPQELR